MELTIWKLKFMVWEWLSDDFKFIYVGFFYNVGGDNWKGTSIYQPADIDASLFERY